MSGVFIAGVGMHVPEKIVTNDDMAKLVDTSDEWISDRTGIKQRHFSEGEPNYHIGRQAAENAIRLAGISPEEIDLIIGCTVTPDFYFPSLACVIQGLIGAKNAFCWDLGAACSGFVYALDVAHTYISMGKAKTVLIVCSETLSKNVDFSDRATCVLFGDGAGAVVVQRGNGLFASALHSEGAGGNVLVCRANRNESPFAQNKEEAFTEYPATKRHYIAMDGREVYRFSTRALAETVEEACSKAGVVVSDLKLIVPHQANIRIIKTAAERLGVPMERMFVNIGRYGNTSSATIPICLAELTEAGRLVRGDLIALAGFGGGLTCGSIVMEW